MRERMRNKKGFTLAELLIVVAIIAVLVAIMIPVFGKSRAEAILARDTANLRSIYAEAITDAMSSDSTTVSIDIKKAIADSDIEFDTNTKAKYTPATTDDNGKIVVSTDGTDKTDTIIIDKDVKLTNGGTELTTETENILNLS